MLRGSRQYRHVFGNVEAPGPSHSALEQCGMVTYHVEFRSFTLCPSGGD